MGLIFLFVLGTILGWLAAIVLDNESGSGITINVAAGVSGALGAGLLLSPLVGGGALLARHYSVDALLLAFVGSIFVIACANVVRRLQPR